MKLHRSRQYPVLAIITLILTSTAASSIFAAEPSLRHYTQKDFILEGERQAFFVELTNPSSDDLRVVKLTFSLSAKVEVRGLDRSCSQWRPNNQTEIICTIPLLKSGASKSFSYSLVGALDARPSFTVAASATHTEGTIAIVEQDSTTTGIADGNREIEGASLTIKVGRDILKDSDGDGVSDASELVQRTDPRNPRSFSRDNAIIDVAVLLSNQTDEYYNDLFGARLEYLIETTNQFYRENKVGITLRLVAMGRVDYSGTSIDQAFDDISSGSSAPFSDLTKIIDGVGADVIVFAHPFFRGGGSDFCAVGQNNRSAVQGDFYRERFATGMVSVIDVSEDCVNLNNLAGVLAFNMGIVTDRGESPEGGTFAFSSGYVLNDYFATFVPSRTERQTSLSAETLRINRLSNPQRICVGQPCGIDRGNLTQGADAVFSLNATAHIISDLAPTKVPVVADDIAPKKTITAENVAAISIAQSPSVGAAMLGDWVSYQVEAQNNSSGTLHHLEFRFGFLEQAELFTTQDTQCAVLAAEDQSGEVDDSAMGSTRGQLVCYVLALEPNQKAGFSYGVKIEESAQSFPTYYISYAAVNNQIVPRASVCTPVLQDSDDTAGYGDCEFVSEFFGSQPSGPRLTSNIDSTLQPVLNGSILTVPFIKLYDGGLISAQFKFIQGSVLALELIDVEYLEPRINPQTFGGFGSDGVLTLRNVKIGGELSTVQLKLFERSDPPLFLQQ